MPLESLWERQSITYFKELEEKKGLLFLFPIDIYLIKSYLDKMLWTI